MKKLPTTKKLSLQTTTLRTLDDVRLSSAGGGKLAGTEVSCVSCHCIVGEFS
jgi:hypothetical protein